MCSTCIAHVQGMFCFSMVGRVSIYKVCSKYMMLGKFQMLTKFIMLGKFAMLTKFRNWGRGPKKPDRAPYWRYDLGVCVYVLWVVLLDSG